MRDHRSHYQGRPSMQRAQYTTIGEWGRSPEVGWGGRLVEEVAALKCRHRYNCSANAGSLDSDVTLSTILEQGAD